MQLKTRILSCLCVFEARTSFHARVAGMRRERPASMGRENQRKTIIFVMRSKEESESAGERERRAYSSQFVECLPILLLFVNEKNGSRVYYGVA